MPADTALQLSDNAVRVLEARYLRRDEERRVVETPAELFERVACGIAEAERGYRGDVPYWQEQFHDLLCSLEFLPNSPALMNTGTLLGQLSACFVLGIDDTMESIFEALKRMALVQRTGGGTGFAFSRLRPRGDVVASTGGEASGPVSFMRIFDCATEHIKQGGRRRGANMGVLRVDHPDILEFIAVKRGGSALPNFNLSVGVTDAFMEAVASGARYDLRSPRTGRATGTLRASDVFDAMVEAAWEKGDPGLLFLDAIRRTNPTPELGDIEATNPCGEVPLLPNESCNLGSINLARMVRTTDGTMSVDWDRLRWTVHIGVRMLDDIIEVNRYPSAELAEAARQTRKIGLGVMGFAELLIRLGISYDSEDAVSTAGRVMAFIADAAGGASHDLAGETRRVPVHRK